MSFSYYQLATQSNTRVLHQLSHLIDKAVDYCAERKIDEQVLLQARLFPDMFPLVRQIQLVSDMTKSCCSRLTGAQPPSYPDTETTFAQLKERIAKTLAYIETVKEADFADCEKREVILPWRQDKPMRADIFLQFHAIPNIYFHITTTYNILRHNGVAVGKADYIGEL